MNIELTVRSGNGVDLGVSAGKMMEGVLGEPLSGSGTPIKTLLLFPLVIRANYRFLPLSNWSEVMPLNGQKWPEMIDRVDSCLEESKALLLSKTRLRHHLSYKV
jgi:hypothetical protein